MEKIFTLKPIGLDFFENAPLLVRSTMVAKCAPEDLMETLRGDTVWSEWAPALKKVVWTSKKPYAKNSTREVSLAGGMMVRENFFHWDENERVAFYVTESNIPGLEAFAEDYLIERLGPNETRLTWTVAITNSGFMSYLNPVTAKIMKLVFRGWLKRYSEILEARASARASEGVAQATAS